MLFCIPLHPHSQYLFVSEWTNPHPGRLANIHECTPSGFRDSPHLFANALAKELRELQLINRALLQYVDDFLISSTNKEDSYKNSILVLNFLTDRGYKVSPKKAQRTSQTVQCLGSLLTPGACALPGKGNRPHPVISFSAPPLPPYKNLCLH